MAHHFRKVARGVMILSNVIFENFKGEVAPKQVVRAGHRSWGERPQRIGLATAGDVISVISRSPNAR